MFMSPTTRQLSTVGSGSAKLRRKFDSAAVT